MESNAKFSPDGKWIAFNASYDGRSNVYLMPSEGGEPKRLTYGASGDQVEGWTPDGKIAFTSSTGAPAYPLPRVWTVKPTGGLPTSTNVLECSELSYSPDGKQLAYNRRGSASFNWRRYRGGTQGKISIWNFDTGAYSELPAGRENSWVPMWVGDTIYYISDKNLQTVNLYSYSTKTKQAKQLTQFTDGDIKWPNTDGKKIVFERDGFLMTYDLGTAKLDTLSPQILSDNVSARPSLRRLGDQLKSVAISPSGKRVVVEARGELFSVPVKNGETRNLTNTPGAKEYSPLWAPDGKTVAYLSDASGEVAIYTIPQMGGTPKKLDTDPKHRITSFRWSPDGKMVSYTTTDNTLYLFDIATSKTTKVFFNKYGGADGYDWSADSKWIAFLNAGENLFGASYLYEVGTNKTTKITEGYFRDDAISFDLSGKYLYLISGRTFNPTAGDFEFDMSMTKSRRVYVIPLSASTPNPFLPSVDEEPAGEKPVAKKDDPGAKIDLNGLAERAIPLPLPADDYQGIMGLDGGVGIFVDNHFVLFNLASKQPADVIANVRTLDVTPKRDKMAFLYGQMLCVSDVRPGIDPNAARVNTGAVEAVIDPRVEWKQIFWEAWRYERDNFYDSNMLGLDWKGIGEKYAKFLPYVSHREDLNYVLGLLIGELGTSHAYVGGGDMGPTMGGPGVGSLAADYETNAGKIRFKKIFRGFNYDESLKTPLGDPGVDVKEGEYLLAIDGNAVTDDTDPSQFLINKVGRSVVLLVNDKPTNEGAREVRVTPIGSDSSVRYYTWVEDNRKKVEKLSGGRIGYMHVPDTSEPGAIGLIRGYYSQSDKEAMIVDERFNGGGMIPTMFIEKLARRIRTAVQSRYGKDITLPSQTFQGPMAMLINEYAGSGGDLFPWFFRQAKLGPLIGNRTWGGLVGIAGSAPLVDGGFLSCPSFGLYDIETGKWIAENNGIEPDIPVDARPDLMAKGQDPQLEKAIEVMLKELDKGKAKIKPHDAYPVVKQPVAK
jgi:tricorn protease